MGFSKGLQYSGRGQNDINWPFLLRFGLPKFADTNFGWFWTSFDFGSIFVIFDLGDTLMVSVEYPLFWACPTVLGLKIGEIYIFRSSRPF